MKSTMFKEFLKSSFTPPIKSDCNSKDCNRIEFFDLAKGICIILVVLNHLFNHINDERFEIPNFHALRMPLYFVLSGMFFKAYELKIFFIKKINNIFVPFLFWLITSDIWHFWNVLWSTRYKCMADFEIVRFIKDPFLYNSIECNGPLWFLFCLFIVNVIFYYVYSICKSKGAVFFAILFIASIGRLLSMKNIMLPLWIDTSLTALPFFFFGFCCREMTCLKPEYSKIKSLFWAVVLIITSYTIYYTFDHACIADMRTNSFHGSYVAVYLNSAFFVMGILLLCKVIDWLPIVSYFGRYSIIVLCIHWPLMIFIPGFIERRIGYKINDWEFLIIMLLICWFAIPLCKRFLPCFVAQKPLFKIPHKKE